MNYKSNTRRIKILRDSVSRKIAAGEVIERPLSVVRELLDNSIDAGSDTISVFIENGGVSSVRVVDNGQGMSKQDLNLCFLPHATSKIESESDIYNITSLGFRGEALSSMAACSSLEIISLHGNQKTAHRIIVQNGDNVILEEYRGNKGTIVSVSDLFYSMPGRKKFLKNPGSEAAMCKSIFLEKAIAFPDISFKYFSDSSMKLFLPASDIIKRITSAFPYLTDPKLLSEKTAIFDNFKISAVTCDPNFFRKNRKYIQVFVNRRKISEFSLIQAVEYGYSEYLPGGRYPISFLFIDIDPQLVDFNIHPAKKEVRFKNLPEIHHKVVEVIKSSLSRYKIKAQNSETEVPSHSLEFEAPSYRIGFTAEKPLSKYKSSNINIQKWRELSNPPVPREIIAGSPYFLGQLFGVFLLAQMDNKLFIIDQHAAHERILFDKFRKSTPDIQKLLIPLSIKTIPDEDSIIIENMQIYKELGIILNNLKPGLWNITALPENCTDMDDEIIHFIKNMRGTKTEFEQKLFASMACRNAIKEGDAVDEITALELIKETLSLENARCPHGRPIWYEISKKELFHLVGRT